MLLPVCGLVVLEGKCEMDSGGVGGVGGRGRSKT